ncbi:MAG: hypothetical protein A2Z29_02065, partial [Chloroflexi bacterium RBG_16_56_11]
MVTKTEGTKKAWSEMTWQEKREERFRRWLSPKKVKFVSPEAEKLYKERVTRFIKAIKMEEPDRVPVILPIGFYPASYAGVSFHDIMYDYGKMRDAWLKFMYEFKDMDTYSGPALVTPGRVLEGTGTRTQKWPGHGLAEDAWYYQIVEGEYMKADEYDLFMKDPSDYAVRVNLPRTGELFEAFKDLPPLRTWQGGGLRLVAAFGNPRIRQVFQKLIALSDEYEKWRKVVEEVGDTVLAEGYPNVRGRLFAGAPFDVFADMLRGTHGIVMDMYRQPEKVIEATEHQCSLTIDMIVKDSANIDCPVIMMPLHKGDDVFMSDKQFEKFYWPTFRKVLLAMINEGLVPFPFAEGKHNHRLKYYADMPKSGVLWYFDQTDMAEAKKVLGNTACIAGNV